MLVSSILQICLTQIQMKEKKILIAMEAISRAMCPENDGTGYVLEKGGKDEAVSLANNFIHSRTAGECFRIASNISKQDRDELTVILFIFRM